MHPRVKREKRIIDSMIINFCLVAHKVSETCSDCKELMDYAEKKLLKCPFIEDKPICSKCDIHCYNKAQQEQIKLVMRTMGPKMIYTNTLDTLWYFFYKFIHRRQRII
jgi:hypothetical protein